MRVKLLTVLVLAALAVVGFVAANRQHRQHKHTLAQGVDGIVIDSAACDEPGLLHVKAHADVKGFPMYVQRLWWEVEIEAVGPDQQAEHVWNESYHEQPYFVRNNLTIHPTLDDKFALPAGHYRVYVRMREDMPQQVDQAGTMDPTPVVMTNSALVEVR
jgi:hypothetical protein